MKKRSDFLNTEHKAGLLSMAHDRQSLQLFSPLRRFVDLTCDRGLALCSFTVCSSPLSGSSNLGSTQRLVVPEPSNTTVGLRKRRTEKLGGSPDSSSQLGIKIAQITIRRTRTGSGRSSLPDAPKNARDHVAAAGGEKLSALFSITSWIDFK